MNPTLIRTASPFHRRLGLNRHRGRRLLSRREGLRLNSIQALASPIEMAYTSGTGLRLLSLKEGLRLVRLPSLSPVRAITILRAGVCAHSCDHNLLRPELQWEM